MVRMIRGQKEPIYTILKRNRQRLSIELHEHNKEVMNELGRNGKKEYGHELGTLKKTSNGSSNF